MNETYGNSQKKEGAQHSEHPREILTNHPAFAKGEPYANSSTFFNIAESDTGTDEEMKYKD